MNRFLHRPDYLRVAAGFTIGGKASCWLNSDPLIIVEEFHATESYRRFELRDLQAVLLYQTRMGQVAAWLLLLGTILFGVSTWLVARSDGSSAALALNAGVAALLGVSLVLHLARGPMARIELRTAVQTLVVPGVYRWRPGLKLFQALEQAVRGVQSEPEPEAGEPRMDANGRE